MSTDSEEYGIPVIFDVTAHSREDAGDALVLMLGGHQLPGNKVRLEGRGTAQIESWWTLESIDKDKDRNDNDAGIVLFDADIDYLHMLLARTAAQGDVFSSDIPRHDRLMAYLHPHGRVGSGTEEEA